MPLLTSKAKSSLSRHFSPSAALGNGRTQTRQMLFSAGAGCWLFIHLHTRAKHPLARPVKTGFFTASILATHPRQTCHLSSEPSDARCIVFRFKVAFQLQSSVRGYVWRDKFYGTVSNFWPLKFSEVKSKSETVKNISWRIELRRHNAHWFVLFAWTTSKKLFHLKQINW